MVVQPKLTRFQVLHGVPPVAIFSTFKSGITQCTQPGRNDKKCHLYNILSRFLCYSEHSFGEGQWPGFSYTSYTSTHAPLVSFIVLYRLSGYETPSLITDGLTQVLSRHITNDSCPPVGYLYLQLSVIHCS